MTQRRPIPADRQHAFEDKPALVSSAFRSGKSAVNSSLNQALRPVPYRVFRQLLPNGLRLVAIETPHLHTASIALYARVGARYETRQTNGLSHFVEHMLFRGSSTFPSSYSLNCAIESLGGTLYAETGRDYSLYQIPLHPAELPGGLAIMGDLFAAPLFSDIDLERKIIIEEILEDLDEHGRNVNLDDVSRGAFWGDHPLGFPITGPVANVRRFRTADIRRHFRRFYGAANMVLCVAGPIDHAEVERMARRAFARLPRGQRAQPRAASTDTDGPRFRFVHNDSAQTQVQVLFQGIPDMDPDYVALAAMVRILDDGMSTRLHYEICDQKGLAYHVSGGLEPLHDSAILEVDAACAHAKLPELVGDVLSLLARFRTERVSEQDLAKAKRRFRGDIEAAYDDLDALSGWYGGTELFYKPRTHAERVRLFEAVTADQVQRVATRVLRSDRLTVAAVGALSPAVAKRVKAVVRDFR